MKVKSQLQIYIQCMCIRSTLDLSSRVSVMCFRKKLCWYICDLEFVIVALCFNGGKSLIILKCCVITLYMYVNKSWIVEIKLLNNCPSSSCDYCNWHLYTIKFRMSLNVFSYTINNDLLRCELHFIKVNDIPLNIPHKRPTRLSSRYLF